MPTKKNNPEIISIGAEATLEKKKLFGKDTIVKTRVPKGYRHPSLDLILRRERTAREARMLHTVKKFGVTAPQVYGVDAQRSTIYMEYVDAPRLKHVLLDVKKKMNEKMQLCRALGKTIATLHGQHIIHGDLTTSNVLVRAPKEENGKKAVKKFRELVMIDFGLSTHSNKLEDAAVDLVNLKKTFSATHSQLEKGWEEVKKGYLEEGGSKEVLKKMEEVEARIRYA